MAMNAEANKLAEDMVSFHDVSLADVVRDFQSAIEIGLEPLRKYGIVMTQADIDREAASLHFTFGQEMDEVTRAQAVLNLMVRKQPWL